jgi:hypothetical protein
MPNLQKKYGLKLPGRGRYGVGRTITLKQAKEAHEATADVLAAALERIDELERVIDQMTDGVRGKIRKWIAGRAPLGGGSDKGVDQDADAYPKRHGRS